MVLPQPGLFKVSVNIGLFKFFHQFEIFQVVFFRFVSMSFKFFTTSVKATLSLLNNFQFYMNQQLKINPMWINGITEPDNKDGKL